MQLFRYAKSAGTPDINTVDCWVGMTREDWKASKKQAT